MGWPIFRDELLVSGRLVVLVFFFRVFGKLFSGYRASYSCCCVIAVSPSHLGTNEIFWGKVAGNAPGPGCFLVKNMGFSVVLMSSVSFPNSGECSSIRRTNRLFFFLNPSLTGCAEWTKYGC